MKLIELMEHVLDNLKHNRYPEHDLIYIPASGEPPHPPHPCPRQPCPPDTGSTLQANRLSRIRWARPEQYRAKPRTININGYDVPAPETQPPTYGEIVFLQDMFREELYSNFRWKPNQLNAVLITQHLKRGLVFKTADGAIQNAKAKLGIDPYSGELSE